MLHVNHKWSSVICAINKLNVCLISLLLNCLQAIQCLQCVSIRYLLVFSIQSSDSDSRVGGHKAWLKKVACVSCDSQLVFTMLHCAWPYQYTVLYTWCMLMLIIAWVTLTQDGMVKSNFVQFNFHLCGF